MTKVNLIKAINSVELYAERSIKTTISKAVNNINVEKNDNGFYPLEIAELIMEQVVKTASEEKRATLQSISLEKFEEEEVATTTKAKTGEKKGNLQAYKEYVAMLQKEADFLDFANARGVYKK